METLAKNRLMKLLRDVSVKVQIQDIRRNVELELSITELTWKLMYFSSTSYSSMEYAIKVYQENNQR